MPRSRSSKFRVLLAPVGTEGDVRPVAALARALVERGHEARLLVAPDFLELCQSQGADPRSIGGPFRPWMEELGRTFNGRPWKAWRGLVNGLRRAVDDEFRLLAPHLPGADLLVGTPLQLAVFSLAEANGIPACHLAHIPTVFESRFHAPPLVPRNLGPFNKMAWRLFFASFDLLVRPSLDRLRRSQCHLPGIGSTRRHLREPLLVAMDPELAPLPPDTPGRVRQCGYLRREDHEGIPPEVEAFLRAGEPPIYIGFGSMMLSEGSRLPEALSGMVRRSQRRFLVCRGWAGLQMEGAKVLVVDRLPHGKVFPRCAAAIHHGGAGTSWTVARSGIPQVVVPHLMDQPWWADRLADLGVATQVPYARATSSALGEAMERALALAAGTSCRVLSGDLAARRGLDQAVGILEEFAVRRVRTG